MLKNVIFDYMGVIANIDYKKMLSNMTLMEKFKALRILIGMKKHPTFKAAFDQYQLGAFDKENLYQIAHEVYPNASSVVPKLLGLIPSCLKENKSVLALAKKLHDDGFKIILLSNSIPETQEKIQNSNMVEYFDGFVLSHLVGMMKPHKEIYDFTCETYGIDPKETIFIDDTLENLAGAEYAKLKTMHCETPSKLAHRLGNLFYSRYQPEPNE
jgi:putative hydrolase of the HAD superfamily